MALNEMLNANTINIYEVKFKHYLNKIVEEYYYYLLESNSKNSEIKEFL